MHLTDTVPSNSTPSVEYSQPNYSVTLVCVRQGLMRSHRLPTATHYACSEQL